MTEIKFTTWSTSDYNIVMETTKEGRSQVKLGLKDKTFDVPVETVPHLYEPAPTPLGKGESITVYDETGKLVIQS